MTIAESSMISLFQLIILCSNFLSAAQDLSVAQYDFLIIRGLVFNKAAKLRDAIDGSSRCRYKEGDASVVGPARRNGKGCSCGALLQATQELFFRMSNIRLSDFVSYCMTAMAVAAANEKPPPSVVPLAKRAVRDLSALMKCADQLVEQGAVVEDPEFDDESDADFGPGPKEPFGSESN